MALRVTSRTKMHIGRPIPRISCNRLGTSLHKPSDHFRKPFTRGYAYSFSKPATTPKVATKPSIVVFKKMSDIDLNQIRFEEPRKTKLGGAIIPVKYGTSNQSLKIQTPTMRVPFGLSIFKDTYSLQASFDDLDTNEQVKEFYEFIVAYEKYLFNAARKNHKLWFKKGTTLESMPTLYPTIKGQNGEYAPLIKFKIPFRSLDRTDPLSHKEPISEIFDDRGETKLEAVTKGSKVKAIIDLSTIWVAGTQFGTTWNLLQAKIVDRGGFSGGLREYAFIDEEIDDPEVEKLKRELKKVDNDDEEDEVEEDEEEELAKPIKKVEVKKEIKKELPKKVVKVEVEEEEEVEDEVEEEEEEEEPEPVKKPAKKPAPKQVAPKTTKKKEVAKKSPPPPPKKGKASKK